MLDLISDLHRYVNSYIENTDKLLKSSRSTAANHAGRIRTLEENYTEAMQRLNAFDPHITEKYLTRSRERALEMDRKIQAMIHQTTVLTEVSRHVRRYFPEATLEIQSRIIAHLDYGDDWWFSRKGLTVCEWLEYFSSEESEPKNYIDTQ